MAKVFLGIGHGGKDSGAVSGKYKEAELNLPIGLACRDELKRHGVTVKMSREKNELDPVMDEVKECNAFNPDLAVDIHLNAGKADGFEAFYHYGGGKGKTLASNIEAEVKKIGQNSRGIKTKVNSSGKDFYAFIRQTNAPAVIVECAFIDSDDVEIVDTLAEQKKFGIAIAKGVLKTLGINYKEEQPKDAPSSYAKESWEWACESGLFDGTNPKGNVTREMLAVILHRIYKR